MKRQRTKWRSAPVLLAFVLMMLAASCSLDSSDAVDSVADAASDSAEAAITVSDSFGGDDADAMEDAMEEDRFIETDADTEPVSESSDAAADALGGGGLNASQLQAVDIGRDIIFTAEISVAVPDVGTAGTAAVEQISRFGGLLFGQQTTTDPTPRSVLTFKVQPGDFQAALAALGTIGDVRNQTVSTDDVTERVVDLQSRIATSEASVQRLRGFLEDAGDLETIASLERQLLERETDLERLKGQLRTVQDRVDLATITLTLVQLRSAPAVNLSVTAYPGTDGGLSCPGGPEGSRIDRDEPMTLCFDIANTGDTALSGFTLRDQALGIDSIDQLQLVFGTADWDTGAATLEPGESVTLAWDYAPAHDARTLTQLSALPIDAAGTSIDGQRVGDTRQYQIRAVDPGGIPSFSDGLTASWDLLKDLALVALLALGVLLPFAWLIVVLLLGWRWFGARAAKRREAELDAARERQPASRPRGSDVQETADAIASGGPPSGASETAE